MTISDTKLYLVCGKIAAGKSTLCTSLGRLPKTVVLSEDSWLSALYGEEMKTISDYVNFSERLRGAIGPHVEALLRAGVSVVMDFPANTIDNRKWLICLGNQAGVSHGLHFLDVSDPICKARLHRRQELGEHPFVVSEEQFNRIASHFVRPTKDEGLNIVVHTL